MQKFRIVQRAYLCLMYGVGYWLFHGKTSCVVSSFFTFIFINYIVIYLSFKLYVSVSSLIFVKCTLCHIAGKLVITY